MDDNTRELEIEGTPLNPEEEDLLFTDEVGIRIFALASGRSIVGIAISETEDSYLVGVPCALLKDSSNDAPVARRMMPVSFFRLMKAQVEIVTFAFGAYKDCYIDYLVSGAAEDCPSMVEFIDLVLDLEVPSPVGNSDGDLIEKVEAMDRAMEQFQAEGTLVTDLTALKVKH